MLYDIITFDIAKSIKILSKVVYYIFAAISLLAFVAGIFALIISRDNIVLVISLFAVFIISAISAFVNSILIYGFGEMIDKIELIKHSTSNNSERHTENKNSTKSNSKDTSIMEEFINNFRK